MPFRQSEHWYNKHLSALSIFQGVPAKQGRYSLIVHERVPRLINHQLAKQFDLTQHSANMDMDGFDAMFIDCRGAEVCCPCLAENSQPNLTLALVDDNSSIPEQLSNNDMHIELVTQAELGGAVIKLRIDSLTRKQSAKHKFALSDPDSHPEGFFHNKNNLIAAASHDLRQPMHAMGLFIESLQNQITNKSQRSILAKLKQSSTDLNELLNNILDLSKLDAGAAPLHKAQLKIVPLLASLDDEFSDGTQHKLFNLQINSCQASNSAMIHTDGLLLTRILRNLIHNAIKITDTGRVNISTEVVASSLKIHISVNDLGPKDIKNYHSNFVTELRLSIARRLSKLLDLDFSIKSTGDDGVLMMLDIPVVDTVDREIKNMYENTPETFEAYKMLIVEDNPSVLSAMHAMLSSMNCDAYAASNIPEALEIINELDELPDLLIVDYQLADGITGDMAIEKIREAANHALPAIIVTGHSSSELFVHAADLGFRVLNKPVNPDTLLGTIVNTVEEYRRVQA